MQEVNRMSKQEAIALLRNLEDSLDSYCELNEEGKTAFRMAIEALSRSEIPNSSDTISRQAAIDAMCELMNSWFGGDPKDEREEIKWMINHLPSAPQEIIRCKNCVHYHTDVFGGELGVTGIWENLIVAHNACDKWAEGMNCVTPDGFCFLAERRVENADVKT